MKRDLPDPKSLVRPAAHHRGEGGGGRLRIELPVGSYVPRIALREAARVRGETPRRRARAAASA